MFNFTIILFTCCVIGCQANNLITEILNAVKNNKEGIEKGLPVKVEAPMKIQARKCHDTEITIFTKGICNILTPDLRGVVDVIVRDLQLLKSNKIENSKCLNETVGRTKFLELFKDFLHMIQRRKYSKVKPTLTTAKLCTGMENYI